MGSDIAASPGSAKTASDAVRQSMPAHIGEPKHSGCFGLGAAGVSKSANIGALLRTGHAFGASFCFTIGTGYDSRAARTADTADTPSHVPMWRYPTPAELSP